MNTGVRRLHDPVFGELALTFEALDVQADPELTVVAFTAEPGAASEEGLRQLGSWAATMPAEQQPRAVRTGRHAGA